MAQFVKLTEKARAPAKGTPGSAGWDLFCTESFTVHARSWCQVCTGIALKPPPGCYSRIAARSGMAVEFGIFVAGGVIDPDYRGPIQIILHNASYHSQTYAENAAIAQLIFERFDSESSIEQVEFFANDGSARGWGKFGSTGRVQPLRDSVARGEEEEEDIAEVTREKLGLNCG